MSGMRGPRSVEVLAAALGSFATRTSSKFRYPGARAIMLTYSGAGDGHEFDTYAEMEVI